jgi:transcriptional regulator with XRE-family HTH domain
MKRGNDLGGAGMKAGSPLHIVVAIREEMAGRGMYHKDLAAHLDITQRHLSMILTGKNKMSLSILFQVLAYLEVPMLLEVPANSPGTAP